MSTLTSSAKKSRERPSTTADDELSKFERKELAFQRAERDERAAQLRYPAVREYLISSLNEKQN